MHLEPRYIVTKIKDANRFLSPAERNQLDNLIAKIAGGRTSAGQPTLECVVIEKDWPEYSPTLAALCKRVDAGLATDSGPTIARELERANARLREALTRLLGSDPEVAKCSDDELSAAVENAPAPEVREQAGAVLHARRVLSA